MEKCFLTEEENVKKMSKSQFLSILVGLLGLAGMALRGSLYAFFVDARNLLPRTHPAAIALWVLTAAVVALVIGAVYRMLASEQYSDNFAISLAAALGHIAMASGILLTVLRYAPSMPGTVGQMWKFLGIASAPLLYYAGFSRAMGKKPFFLGYVVTSVFFAFHLVCHYRTWCSDPQLLNYAFAFLGSLGLMLFAYYQAAACVGMGKRRMLLGVGLVTAYLCLTGLPAEEYLYLYLGGAVWCLTGLCNRECALSPEEKAGDAHAAS